MSFEFWYVATPAEDLDICGGGARYPFPARKPPPLLAFSLALTEAVGNIPLSIPPSNVVSPYPCRNARVLSEWIFVVNVANENTLAPMAMFPKTLYVPYGPI